MQEIRRQNLRRWLEAHSTPAKERSYFSQLLAGKASFGEKAARRLEKDYAMGEGFLDTPTGWPSAPAQASFHVAEQVAEHNVSSTRLTQGVSETIEHLGRLLDALPPEKQSEAAQRLGALALGDSEKNRTALVALLTPIHPAAETADFAGKPQTEKIDQSTPSFLK
jgi:hypothetical protein